MIKTNPLSVQHIEKIANNFRKQFDIANNNYFPILDILDTLFESKLLSYQIVQDDFYLLSDDIPAVYNPKENFMYIKQSVIYDYENNNYRAAFTLCHELFHFLQSSVFQFDFVECEECKLYENVEWQANEFAGQLLIPSQFVDFPDDILQEMFHVSLECVLTRKAKAKIRKAL